MLLPVSLLCAAPAAAWKISSLFDFVPGGLDLGADVPAMASSGDGLSPGAKAASLIRKYGSDVPGAESGTQKQLTEFLRDFPEGYGQLDEAFARRVAKDTPTADARARFAADDAAAAFETFTATALPDHRLRYRSPSELKVDATKQYSGYLDFGEDLNNHLFFWFFESRNDPANDPVVLWLNGGPGCSSLTGLFFELGPSRITADLEPQFNEFSWNNNASIIFVDQPVNVGLSYSNDGTEPVNSVVAERDVYALLELFFQRFPEYADRAFHIAGESYAGHYIPALGAEIWAHKDRSFGLDSLLIGNGLTDPAVQYTSYADMACGRGGYPAVLDDEQCHEMEEDTPKCVRLIKKCYHDQSDWSCLPATVFCNNKMFYPYLDAGYNFYDVRQKCGNQPCYGDEEYGADYLNQRSVQEALGAPGLRFESCNNRINSEFVNDGDWMRPYSLNVTQLLNDGVRVLVYAGDADYAVNWLGNERWTRALDWQNAERFAAEPLTPWYLGRTEVGQVRSHGPLTFARVYGGGHMLPHDQPEASLDLFNRWISNESYA